MDHSFKTKMRLWFFLCVFLYTVLFGYLEAEIMNALVLNFRGTPDMIMGIVYLWMEDTGMVRPIRSNLGTLVLFIIYMY